MHDRQPFSRFMRKIKTGFHERNPSKNHKGNDRNENQLI